MPTATAIPETATTNANPVTCHTDTRSQAFLAAPGFGQQASHWGECVQGPVEHRGRTITGLITLPRKDRFSQAVFRPSSNSSVVVHPRTAVKAKQAAREVLNLAGMSDLGGELIVAHNTREGCGNGSSTADIIASIRATCEATGVVATNEEVQNLCWTIEGASDPLALIEDGNAFVYGSRHGQIIRNLGRPLPPMICLGFNTDPDRTVITASLVGRERFMPGEVREFAAILETAIRGIEAGQLTLVAKAATESARLNQKRVNTRNFELLVGMALGAGALGVSVSHSGTVAAMIFDPDCPNLCERLDDMNATVKELGGDDIGVFSVNVPTRRRSLGRAQDTSSRILC